MRIAYVITRGDAVGGATVHVRDLARAMRERGCEVRVFVGGDGPVAEQFFAAGVPFHKLERLRRAVSPAHDLLALRELTRALREFRPDLVSTHTAKAGWIGRAASARLGLPAIYTPHGWPAGDRMPAVQAAVFALAERTAARWASRIVCVCEQERNIALVKRIAPPEKLTVVHNGVADVPPELRATPATEPVRIACVARFEKPKDHASLLRALAPLGEMGWELDLIGDGPLERQIRDLAAALGLQERVRFLGYQPDVAALLAQAQIFALSSRSEAFPRSILEAMRAGLPVVATEVGGIAEAVDNGGNGVLTPRGDVASLTTALGKLIQRSTQRERMGAAARQKYETSFRLERMVAATVAVYESVLKGHAGN